MTLIVPTSNVSFSLGSNVTASDPTMGKSLDDMIKDRRKEQAQASRRGPKKIENADRAVATSRAKRAAAANARRGLSESKKPTAMEVEKEVYREARKTAVAKERKQQKAAGGRLPPDSSSRRQRKKTEAKKTGAAKGKQQQVATAVNNRPPPKKVVKAAVSAMREKGYEVPDGMKVVISFEPTASPANAQAKKGGATGNTNNNKKGGKGNSNNGNGNNNNNNKQQKSPANKNTPNKNNGGGRRKK